MSNDATLGIVLVALGFGFAIASGWIIVAVVTGIVLAAVMLA